MTSTELSNYPTSKNKIAKSTNSSKNGPRITYQKNRDNQALFKVTFIIKGK
jgi:hypothetical protein